MALENNCRNCFRAISRLDALLKQQERRPPPSLVSPSTPHNIDKRN